MQIYHGTDHILSNPEFGKGKADNDYGSGFYTTENYESAVSWALGNGSESSIVNKYSIDCTDLNIVYLDEHGPLAWIAEIISNRGARGEQAQTLANKISDLYKIDTSHADIIVGYRADDSYMDIVDAFLSNMLSIEETERLFRKGNLGEQVFIKSPKAFHLLHFEGYDKISEKEHPNFNKEEIRARMEVSKFLRQRNNMIQVNGYVPVGILARDTVQTKFEYDKNYNYYYQTESAIEPQKTKGEITDDE